ncbi:unnamed protein product [Pleuronectes platessa]|uniref:Uncharacterized protein n=1 Tax=Pleuronectes platessa TaxID=8262 RepID=A0A9N7V9P1_PLEPL|nr:unnamed protein product [Pleuronectes platessa]
MSTVPKTLEKNNSRDLLWFPCVQNQTLECVQWDYDRKVRNFTPYPFRESRYIALDHTPTIISPAPGRDEPAPRLACLRGSSSELMLQASSSELTLQASSLDTVRSGLSEAATFADPSRYVIAPCHRRFPGYTFIS